MTHETLSTQSNSSPILYSLRNCPYAMRARMAIYMSNQRVKLRAVKLNNKPDEMIAASAKATVPILVISQSLIIAESIEVMLWALAQNDPDDLLHSQEPSALPKMFSLIGQFDHQFKGYLEQYKCAKRYHEDNLIERRQACELHLQQLEERLNQHQYLSGEAASLADIAILPFIRQFARVERQWYLQAPYPKLRQWLNHYLQSKMFSKVMVKHPLWLDNRETIYFGDD